MSDRYTYVDPDGVPLVVDGYQHASLGPVAAVKTGGSTLYITESALPEIVAALYEAVGRPAPIVLERPAGEPGRVGGYMTALGHVYPFHAAAGPLVGLPESGQRFLPRGDALAYAAVVAAVANDLAPQREEPDPAEVAELTNIIAGMRATAVPPKSADIAREALRWMREREASQ